ncbi:MAG: hypothetical protein IPL83_12650 [Bdellovibrionales bacterium]|nr:hypothetical protein [Bdellovibrionales bacterium]
MKKWDSVISEKPSRDHQNRVMSFVGPELQELKKKYRREFLKQIFATGAVWSSLVALAVSLFFLPRLRKWDPVKPMLSVIPKGDDIDMLAELDLLEDLDFLDALELLEQTPELDEV